MIRVRVRGLTLIELVAALAIAAVVVALGLQYLRPTGDQGKQRSCDATREILQDYADRHREQVGVSVSRDLRELEVGEYAGPTLPTCPATGRAYRLDGNGVVGCPIHEPTRGN